MPVANDVLLPVVMVVITVVIFFMGTGLQIRAIGVIVDT